MLVLFAAAVILPACSSGKKPPGNKPVPVVTAVAVKKTIPVQIRAMGSVEAFQSISVRSQITAQIAKVFFREGQDVKKGELLLALDCRTTEADLAQAQATLAKDRALARYADEQVKRYADLLKKDYVAKEQYEQFQASAAALQATIRSDEALVESSTVKMQYCSIYSPIDGRAGMLKVNQGNLVKENDTEILTINQIQPVNVAFAIPEKDLPRVKKHLHSSRLEVKAFIPGEDNPEAGELTFVDNAIDRTTGTITLKGTFANGARRLMPGQFVNVVLILANEPDVVTVPSQSVEQGQEGPYVYVVGQGSTVELRQVATGADVAGETVIVTGLKPGERVVTDGQMRLTPGAKVTLKTSN